MWFLDWFGVCSLELISQHLLYDCFFNVNRSLLCLSANIVKRTQSVFYIYIYINLVNKAFRNSTCLKNGNEYYGCIYNRNTLKSMYI